jgi:D-sedoheptulose 7-phosphate isomerase
VRGPQGSNPDFDVVRALAARVVHLRAAMEAFEEREAPSLRAAAELVCSALTAGRTLFTCGNGGSSADAMHVEAELLARYRAERRPLPAVYLGASASTATATANDYDYADVFARPLRALGRPGDALLALSTSGRSPNVLRALDAAREREVRTVLLTGDGAPDVEADVVVRVAGETADAVQDGHHLVVHALMDAVEARFAG